ncbi:hypothetical protein FF1_009921 [Malus domestica]
MEYEETDLHFFRGIHPFTKHFSNRKQGGAHTKSGIELLNLQIPSIEVVFGFRGEASIRNSTFLPKLTLSLCLSAEADSCSIPSTDDDGAQADWFRMGFEDVTGKEQVVIGDNWGRKEVRSDIECQPNPSCSPSFGDGKKIIREQG